MSLTLVEVLLLVLVLAGYLLAITAPRAELNPRRPPPQTQTGAVQQHDPRLGANLWPRRAAGQATMNGLTAESTASMSLALSNAAGAGGLLRTRRIIAA